MSPLVSYDSSEDSTGDEAVEEEPRKRRRLSAPKPAQAQSVPPLPAAFYDLYATNSRPSTSDDPSLHEGRKRQIPHVDGHWPTHVYLEWRPDVAQHKILSGLVTASQDPSLSTTTPTKSEDALRSTRKRGADVGNETSMIHSLLETPFSTPAPLHISISRTLSPTTEQRAPLLAALKRALQSPPFDVEFREAEWFPNFEGNRWFLALEAERPEGDELNALLRGCNQTVKGAGFEGLYVNQRDGGKKGEGEGEESLLEPGNGGADEAEKEGEAGREERDFSRYFHVSLAWALNRPPEAKPLSLKPGEKLVVQFGAVKVKIGNAIHSIALTGAKKS